DRERADEREVDDRVDRCDHRADDACPGPPGQDAVPREAQDQTGGEEADAPYRGVDREGVAARRVVAVVEQRDGPLEDVQQPGGAHDDAGEGDPSDTPREIFFRLHPRAPPASGCGVVTRLCHETTALRVQWCREYRPA